MFRGLNAVNIDAKGRFAIPTRYRQDILHNALEGSPHLIITIDTESPCLLLYSLPEWELIEAKLQNLSSFNRVTRRIQRLLIGHATELEMDIQGRILLPTLLREYASLDKNAMLVGQGKKFEIWDANKWQDSRELWLKEELGHRDALPDELTSLSL